MELRQYSKKTQLCLPYARYKMSVSEPLFPVDNNMLGPVPIKDMQTPPQPPLRSGHIYMYNTQCAEMNKH